MKYEFYLLSAASLIATLPLPATAESVFGTVAVSDYELAAVRGTFVPAGFALTKARLRTIQDDMVQAEFRFIGTVGRVTMDNWWASDGAALIDANAAARSDVSGK